MKKIAKVFKTGGSQAIRLPREFRFEESAEVWIHREGNRVILEAKRDGWNDDFLSLAGSARSFPYPADPTGLDQGPDLD